MRQGPPTTHPGFVLQMEDRQAELFTYTNLSNMSTRFSPDATSSRSGEIVGSRLNLSLAMHL